MASRAKRFDYAASLEKDGRILAEGLSPVELPEAWLPEHLVLAAVAACTLKSLEHYAREASLSASALTRGTVTRRDEDGLYALVEVSLEFDVELEPEPPAPDLRRLLARAERGCFVGNSLRAKPHSAWRVNGRAIEPDHGT